MRKKQITTKVRVGGFDYEIIFKKLKPHRNGFKPIGTISFEDREIWVDPRGVPPEEVYFTIFHELLHACIEAALDNYSVKDVQDDKFVHPFSRFLWDGMKSAALLDRAWEKPTRKQGKTTRHHTKGT